MSQGTLHSRIIEVSQADDWNHARTEWELHRVWEDEDLDSCWCGRSIRWVCQVVNTENDNTALVGSGCINWFGGNPDAKLEGKVRRVLKNAFAVLSQEVVDLALKRRAITKDQQEAYRVVRRRGKRSPDEMDTRWWINRIIFNAWLSGRLSSP